ncbi:vitellogenin-1-like [Pseudophryne corroboree]|uniref:vitellogenin-1-like n=1 Tax=Pseudophryne corroboree TaxID=495146 RepID=UPI003081A120
MWGVVLALSATLAAAGNQHLRYGKYNLEFSSSKKFSYDYEGLVLSGLSEDGFAKSGIRIRCTVEISAAAPRLYYLKIRNIDLQEYNGYWPTDKFTSAPKLTKLLEIQLVKPIKFEYHHGQVGDLHLPSGLSDTTVNILKGILNILQLTIKKTHNAYSLQENGIGGVCHASYLIRENRRNQLLVTKSVDLNDCEHRERMVTGNAYLHSCASCKQRNKNSRAAVTYNYKVKATDTGGRLLEAEVSEVHQFTPFNEIDGAVIFEARQRLVLSAVQEQIHSTPENNDYITKESLHYHFERKLIQTPIQLLSSKNAENQISDLLHYLVEHNMGPLSQVSPEKFLQLVQHLRMVSFEHMEGIWRSISGRQHYRRWFLDAVPAIGSHLSLQFLKVNIKELTEFEAAQAVPLALHLIKADHDSIAEAKSLLEAVKSQGGSLLRKVTYLAYGSLVHKFCRATDFCSDAALQPLHDLLTEATNAMRNDEMILALKALGNAGQLASIKYILKFLPRISSMASHLPVPIQAAAVMALKNVALKDPTKVFDICLQLYMDVQQLPVLRMRAAAIIMDTRPPSAVIMAVAKSLVDEDDVHVGSFVYTLLKRLSKSVTPDLHEAAAVCNMAITLLKSKYEARRNAFRSGFTYDTFTDSLMSGFESTFNILHGPGDALPVAALGRLKTYFLGVFTDLFEIGYHAEGLQELLMNRHFVSSDSGLQNIKKIMDMMKKLHAWKPLSSKEPLASAYLKMFGQEIFYHELNKNSLENILKFLPVGKHATLQAAVTDLQNGLDVRWSKPLLSSENRLIVPTCVGLPLETSLYYSSVTRAQLQAQAHITPDLKEGVNIHQLLASNINLKSKFSLSINKDIVFMMGVNTNLMQAGMELRTKVNVILPVDIEATFNIEEKYFKVDYIPNQQENEVVSIRTKAFAVTRNMEDSAAAKMTPVVTAGMEPNVPKQTFNPRDLSVGGTPSTKAKFPAKLLSRERYYWRRQPPSSDFSVCSTPSNLGFQLCMERKCVTASFVRNCPLYRIIGDHSFKLIFKPVHTDASVEKIQIEFQAGPEAAAKMVRSVNVQRADSGARETENPIHNVALSALKKILGSYNVTIEKDISGNSEDSCNPGNTSEFSLESSSSSRKSPSSSSSSSSSQDQRQHKKKIHHIKHRHRGKFASGEGKNNQEGSHETHEIYWHNGQDKEKEMRVHCKCWPEKEKEDHRGKHEKWEHGNQEEGQHEKNAHENHRKGQHDAEEHEEHHKRHHEAEEHEEHHMGQDKAGEHRGNQTYHHEAREHEEHHKGNQEARKHEEHRRCQHEAGEHKEHHKGQHGISKEKQHKDSDESGWKDHRHKGRHENKKHTDRHRANKAKRHCTCWRNKNHHKGHLESKGRHHSSENSRVRIDKKTRCKFQSSTNSEKLKNSNKNESHHDTYTRQSSDYMDLFGQQIHTAKFTSAATLLDRRSSSSSSEYQQNYPAAAQPRFVLLVKAIMSNGQHQGYQTTAYSHPVKSRAQMVTASVDEKSSWKTCFDASISGHRKASAVVRWGENCKDYRLAAGVSTGRLAGSPAVQLSWQWKRLPTWLKSAVESVMTFVPGVAYTLGISETRHKNSPRQVTLRVAAPSTETLDAVLKTPELTFYKQAIPIPMDLSLGAHWLQNVQLIQLTSLPETSSMVRRTQEAVCTVDGGEHYNVNNLSLDCSLTPANCYAVIAQDCTNQLRFLIAMKKLGQAISTFEWSVAVKETLRGYRQQNEQRPVLSCAEDIKIYADVSEERQILLNGMWLLLENDTYINDKDCIRIHKNATTVTIQAPKNGVQLISYDGRSAKVHISPLMRGKTCGLCGNADHYGQNDHQMPNHETAKSCNGLVHSWTIPGASCQGSCALSRQYIMLENDVIDGRQSSCYSMEPVLRCMRGCLPTKTVPVTVAFHCVPRDSAVPLADWQANPREQSEDLTKEVDAHVICVCTEECAKI